MNGTASNAGPNPPSLAEPPSTNYETSRDTLVYRLSELTFGSLLAGYILGFIGLAASAILLGAGPNIFIGYYKSNYDPWLVAVQVFIYVFISGTYAYFTAVIYMRYHLGILTMPTFAVGRSRLDFTVAVAQAGLFGISMLIPQSFSLCVAALLWATIWRQRREVNELTAYFTDQIEKRQYRSPRGDPRTWSETHEALKKKVKATIKASKPTGWRPVSTWLYFGTGVLTLMGVVLSVLPYLQNMLLAPDWLRMIYVSASLILFGCVVFTANKTMEQGSRYLQITELDKEYDELDMKLHKLSEGNQ